ncbi:MAG: YqaJ viral recombinase family protein [Hominimerdicola sp.]
MNVDILEKTSDISREKWLELRTKGIGGSDVSVIAGINPYKSAHQLWLEKTGQIEPEQADSEFTHFGTLLEPIVKKEFTERTGIKVRNKKAVLKSRKYPFMIADLDGVVNVNGEQCIFEAKTASAYKQKEWNDKIPLEYMLQIQHYMAVTGVNKTYIAALIGGNRFVYHLIERNEKVINKIIAMEKKFWKENVLGGEEPVPDGSASTSEYLNCRFAVSNGKTINLPENMLSVCHEYDRLSEQIEKLKKQKDAVVNQIKNCMKEAEIGLIGSYTVSWKQINSISFDKNKFKSDNPVLYGKYVSDSHYRRFSISSEESHG